MTHTAASRISGVLFAFLALVLGLGCFAAPALGQSKGAVEISAITSAGRHLLGKAAAASEERSVRPVALANTDGEDADPQSSVLSRTVSVHVRGATVEETLERVARAAGMELAYLQSVVSVEKRVSLDAEEVSVREALREILRGTDLKIMFLPSTELIWVKQREMLVPPNLSADRAPAAEMQAGTISGTVTDSTTGNPLPGVNVVVSGTQQGASTDGQGQYTISGLEPGTYTLQASFVGYATKSQEGVEVIEEGTTEVNFQLSQSAIALDEVVAVGYGEQRQSEVTGSISSVDAEQLTQRAPTNVYEAIQGQMAGVQLTTNSGAPGEGASVRIRGVSTFSGGADPLYILDGQPVESIDHINPNNIESIEVLKDGASAAIYGSKSANGVVIISTKDPVEGEADINISYLKSFVTPRILPVATTNQRLDYEQFRGIIGHRATLDSLNQQFYANNNFQDIMYRTAQKDEINASVSAGSEDIRVYWNTGFVNEDGLVRTTNFKRINSRLNLDYDFNDRISVGARSSISHQTRTNIDRSLEATFIRQMLTISAFSRIYDADGSYMRNVNNYRGRPAFVREYELLDVKRNSTRGNLFGDVDISIVDGLSYTANVGVEFDYSRDRDFFPEFVLGRDNIIESDYRSGLAWNGIHESYLNYETSFNKHELSALAGFSLQKWENPTEQINANLANSVIPTLNNASQIFIGETFTLNQENHSLISGYARLRYNYDNKYLLNATIRRDGSSRFGADNQWGNFPSLSVGWRFSEEPFMDGVGFISDARIRASYAITGNERIGNREFSTLLTTGNFYNGLNGIGLSPLLGNPSIRWEQTNQTNVGLNLDLFGARVNLSADYYVKNTRDLLANRPLPAQTGFNNLRVNLGNVENRGLEVSVNATPYVSTDLIWRTNFNLSTNASEVKELAGGVPIISNYHITREGSPIGSFYGYTILDVFSYDESNAFTPEGEQLTPNFDDEGNFTDYTLDGQNYNGEIRQITVGGITPEGGDFYWKDVDGDFNIDGDDRQLLGNPYPKYYGGFGSDVTYKNVTLGLQFDYQFDAQVYNSFMSAASQLAANSQTPPPFVLENLWSGPGDETAVYPGGPRRSQNELGQSSATSYWVEDADFIKLRNVRLSYDIPERLASKVSMDRLTVYGTINNALVWTNYRGFDPEVNTPGNPLQAGVDYARYPRGREFIIGINTIF